MIKKETVLILLFHLCLLLFPLKLFAQLEYSQGTDQSFYSHVLPSHNGPAWLVRYRVILPQGYKADEIHSVVYFLHGRNGDRFNLESLGVLDRLNYLAKNKGKVNFIMVAPECGNCYWMNAALKDERWGDAVTQELIADVENKYYVYREPAGRLLAGISMGGHGTIQLALNNPNVFGALAAHSPVFRTQEEASCDFYYQFGTGDAYQYRDPFSLIKFKNRRINVPLWMDIGAQDFAFQNTNNFANLLREVGYNGELHVGEDKLGTHSGEYWSYHLYSYLDWYSTHLK